MTNLFETFENLVNTRKALYRISDAMDIDGTSNACQGGAD